jgi:hypothetical protein
MRIYDIEEDNKKTSKDINSNIDDADDVVSNLMKQDKKNQKKKIINFDN